MNKFILAGTWEDGSTVFYVSTDSKTFYGYPIRQLTTKLETATVFNSKEEVENTLLELHDPILKAYQLCPRCGHMISFYPAISRVDNKTEICADCGMHEALEIWKANKEKGAI